MEMNKNEITLLKQIRKLLSRSDELNICGFVYQDDLQKAKAEVERIELQDKLIDELDVLLKKLTKK